MTNVSHIVLPFGDRQTLFSFDSDGLTALESFPLFPLEHHVSLGNSFLATFAACRSALVVQAWWSSGRVGAPEVIELPKGVSGEAFLVTDEDELFVGGKSDRPWLGRMNLCEAKRVWVSVLPEEDLDSANEKGIDALSLTPYGERLIAYDNLMLPLYAWIVDRSEQSWSWSRPRRIKIEPEYTYEHIVSAHATDDRVYLITRGINHGHSMQFLRRFDRSAGRSELLLSETENDSWSRESDNQVMYERGQEWSQVVATGSGTVLIAAGNNGLGRYDADTGEMTYQGGAHQVARHLSLSDDISSVVVSFENTEETAPYRWELAVFSTQGRSDYPRLQLNRRFLDYPKEGGRHEGVSA